MYCAILIIIGSLHIVYGEDTCNEIPDIPKSKLLNESATGPFTVNTTLRFVCKTGFTASGPRPRARCSRLQNGTTFWNIEYFCRALSCGYPGDIENGYRIGQDFTYPNNVTYKCNNGFEFERHVISVIFCQNNGEWTRTTLPECKIISCSVPSRLDNGTVDYTEVTYGSTLTYNCDKGFILVGDKTRHCNENKTWSGTMPACKVVECPQPQPTPGGTFSKISGGPPDKYYVGTLVSYFCHGVLKLTAKCLEIGAWNAPPPHCSVSGTVTTVMPTRVNPTVITTDETTAAAATTTDNTTISKGKNKKSLPIGYIIGIPIAAIILISGITALSIYLYKRKKAPTIPVKPSKASLSDAITMDEVQRLEKYHRTIPVTVL